MPQLPLVICVVTVHLGARRHRLLSNPIKRRLILVKASPGEEPGFEQCAAADGMWPRCDSSVWSRAVLFHHGERLACSLNKTVWQFAGPLWRSVHAFTPATQPLCTTEEASRIGLNACELVIAAHCAVATPWDCYIAPCRPLLLANSDGKQLGQLKQLRIPISVFKSPFSLHIRTSVNSTHIDYKEVLSLPCSS